MELVYRAGKLWAALQPVANKSWGSCAATESWSSTTVILQVLYEAQLEGGDTLGMQDALIQRLAEKDSQYYGQQISGTLTVAKSAAAGAIRDVKFLDTETCFWQLTQQQTMQHKAGTADLVPHLGDK